VQPSIFVSLLENGEIAQLSASITRDNCYKLSELFIDSPFAGTKSPKA